MILVGDALDRLREMPAQSVQTCVTSPPFWQLRDYGEEGQLGLEERPEEYVEKLVEIFREVRRVLRDDGTVWLDLGDTYASKTRGSDKGWEKSRLTNPGTVQKAQSASLRNGNGDRHRGKSSGLKEKDLVGIPWLVAFALRDDGWFLRRDIIWSKPNAMPESIRDRPSSSHEYLFLLSKKARYFYDGDAIRHPYAPGSKERIAAGFKDRYDGMAAAIPNAGHRGVYGGPNGEQVNPGGRNKRSVWEVPEELYSQFLQWLAMQEELVPDVWDITTQPFPQAHFAVFPPKLVEPCIRAGTPPQTCAECGAPWVRQVERERLREGEPIEGTWSRPDEPRRIGPTGVGHYKEETRVRTVGWEPSCDHAEGGGRATVLDPFAGAGTTGLVAAQLDREFVGVELSPFFAEMAEDRIARYLANPNGHLPGDPEPVEGQMGLLG